MSSITPCGLDHSFFEVAMAFFGDSCGLGILLLALILGQVQSQSAPQPLCVIGCTPYVDLSEPDHGVRKYEALVRDMASNCEVLVHVGDTKPGKMACNRTLVTESIHILRRAAGGKPVLYAPGDNELNDCHRHEKWSDFLRASDARDFVVHDLKLAQARDITGLHAVEKHELPGSVPGTNKPYRCDFDTYLEMNNYAVATLEVIGSHYYLGDERKKGYPLQDKIDPLADRLELYLNANDCALDWIDHTVKKAVVNGKRALFLVLHAAFYSSFGRRPLGNNGIGDYYDTESLRNITREYYGAATKLPYKPVFDKLTAVAKRNPDLMIYVVHSDAHRFQTIRMNPTVHNRGPTRYFSNHNVMLHQVEGASRSLTTYTKFTVDDDFQPVTLKEVWSEAAYNAEPFGHSWIPY